jgi:parvulin-like peptidyl-prolyl isomerase
MVSAPPREVAGASQVLVAYKGAELAPKGVTRSKADAKKIAEDALRKIKKDKVPFEDVAKKVSDDEGSKNAGGAIGNFERNAMPEAFSKATFDLKVGEISDVVETPRGFHIIKRTR